jgi:uncharacterized membrane protein
MSLPLLFASAGSVSSEVDANTGWENLSLILTKPDNVPILIMIVMFSFYTYLALRDARRNDRLTKEGRKQEILKQMQE